MCGYLGITALCLGEGSCRTDSSYLLSCDRIIRRRTGEHICKSYKEALKDYDIEHKIDFIITDNASNVCKAFTASFPSDADDLNMADADNDILNSNEEDIHSDPFLILSNPTNPTYQSYLPYPIFHSFSLSLSFVIHAGQMSTFVVGDSMVGRISARNKHLRRWSCYISWERWSYD